MPDANKGRAEGEAELELEDRIGLALAGAFVLLLWPALYFQNTVLWSLVVIAFVALGVVGIVGRLWTDWFGPAHRPLPQPSFTDRRSWLLLAAVAAYSVPWLALIMTNS